MVTFVATRHYHTLPSTRLFGEFHRSNKKQGLDCLVGEDKSVNTFRCPLLPYGYRYKASCANRVKPSFVIFDIWAL